MNSTGVEITAGLGGFLVVFALFVATAMSISAIPVIAWPSCGVTPDGRRAPRRTSTRSPRSSVH